MDRLLVLSYLYWERPYTIIWFQYLSLNRNPPKWLKSMTQKRKIHQLMKTHHFFMTPRIRHDFNFSLVVLYPFVSTDKLQFLWVMNSQNSLIKHQVLTTLTFCFIPVEHCDYSYIVLHFINTLPCISQNCQLIFSAKLFKIKKKLTWIIFSVVVLLMVDFFCTLSVVVSLLRSFVSLFCKRQPRNAPKSNSQL